MSNGVVVLDTNALKIFEDPEVREKLFGSLRAANLILRLSTTNIIEILKTENPRVRDRLLVTARALCEQSYLMPPPTALLKQASEAFLQGESFFRVAESGVEWILFEPERLTSEHLTHARRIWAEQEQTWDDAYARGRSPIRRVIEENHGRDPWGSVSEFLDQHWMRVNQLDTFMERTWEGLSLPGKAPIEMLMCHETWRMYFEAQGAVIYERIVANQATRPAETADVYQMVYLTGAARRILVTEDRAFRRVSAAVLLGRYLGSRVMTPQAFLDGAG